MFALIIPLALTALLTQTAQAPNSQEKIPNPPKVRVFTSNQWQNLFDGKTLADWKRTEFGGGGDVTVEKRFRGGQSAIMVNSGVALSGFNWTGSELPKTNYEVALEGMKIEGSDFFCGLTFPVGESHASLILGGWGGGTVGISNIDNRDASDNETTQHLGFRRSRWFKIRVRVTPATLEAWIDDKKIITQQITGRNISLRHGEISQSIPLGISTYQTSAAFRTIKLRGLSAKEKR